MKQGIRAVLNMHTFIGLPMRLRQIDDPDTDTESRGAKKSDILGKSGQNCLNI